MRIYILGFDWDDINIAKVRRHDLEPDDVEEVFSDAVILDHPEHPRRLLALGHVPDGRFVLVPFEYADDLHWVRVVTAYEAAHQRYWKLYEGAKGGARRPRPRPKDRR